jgi:hypothetical protein
MNADSRSSLILRGARRPRGLALLPFSVLLALAGPGAALAACTRHADLRDEVDGGQIDDPTPDLDADIKMLDTGLGTDAFPECSERPQGDCVGSNDFLCGFTDWAINTAKQCQKATGCKTNGSVEVTMGATGCVTAIGMDQPNDEMVACLLVEFGSVQCPCTDVERITHYFGIGNDGTCPAD